MDDHERSHLWGQSFESYYQCYFEEMVAEKLGARWLFLDNLTKLFVAATASGSAISGWALWGMPNFRFVWVLVAGSGALFSVIHAALGVQSKVKEWESSRKDFTSLRFDIETFRQKIAIDSNVSSRALAA